MEIFVSAVTLLGDGKGIWSGARNYRPPQTQCGGRRVMAALCHWEKEILALGPKTSLGHGHMVFLREGQEGGEFDVMPLISLSPF